MLCRQSIKSLVRKYEKQHGAGWEGKINQSEKYALSDLEYPVQSSYLEDMIRRQMENDV